MGCGTSGTMVMVQPMRPASSSQDETGSIKHGGHRGDSAVSKITTDSGVVMEAGRDPTLVPGALPRKLPPLTAAGLGPGGVSSLQGPDAGLVERPASSQILEQLQSQGIIPADLPRERSSVSGEAYSIVLSDGEVSSRRRLPARLESLSSPAPSSREAVDHKMRLTEERSKLKEDELKSGQRTKSARLRPTPAAAAPASSPGEEEDPALLPTDPPGGRRSLGDPLHPPSPPPSPPPQHHGQVRAAARGEPEGREWAREAASHGVGGEDGAASRGDGTEEGQGQLESLELLDAELETVESDDTFQHAGHDDDDIF